MRNATLAVFLLALTLLIGCGGNVQTASVHPSPTPTPTPAATPVPTPSPTPAPQTIVFIGDSLVANWNTQAAFPQFDDINKGISGNSVPQMDARFQTDVIALKPNTVVIWGSFNSDQGTPITIQTIESDWQDMFQQAHAAGINVVFISLSPHGGVLADANPDLIILNTFLKSFAAANGARFADVWNALLGPDGTTLNPAYAVDDVHINAAGYAAIQPIVGPQL